MKLLILFIPILIVIFVLVLAWVISYFFSPLKKRIKELNGFINKQGEGVFDLYGKTFFIKYTPGGRNQSPQWTISVAGEFAADLKIRDESSFDKFCKDIGLNKEPQLLDSNLNRKYYYECDIPEFVKQLYLNASVKPLVDEILNKFTSIQISKTKCSFTQNPSPALESIKKDKILESAKILFDFAKYVPRVVTADHPEIVYFKTVSYILYVIGYATLVAGLCFWVWAGFSFQVIDAWNFWNLTLMWATGCFIVVGYLAFINIKGFSTSSKVFIHFLIVFGIGVVLLARYGGATYNAVNDSSRIKHYEQVVIDKYTTRYKGRTTYHALVKPWHPSMKNWHLTVSSNTYSGIVVGSSVYDIATKSGRLGYEWLVSEHLIGDSSKIDHLSYFYEWPSKDYSNWYPMPNQVKGIEIEEIAYWQQWALVIQDGITNRMNMQEGLESQHISLFSPLLNEYKNRQKIVLDKLSQIPVPDRLRQFHDYVIDAGQDQIRFYEAFAEARARNSNITFEEFRNHEALKATDQKLWAAYHYFQSLYPNRDQATNDWIEKRLAWFDII